VRLPYSSNFFSYQPKKISQLSVSEALHLLVTKPLTRSELSEGHVYIFWDGNFGKLKIGRTNNLQARLEQWNRQCDSVHNYHPHKAIALRIPHVARVEALVHAELKGQRRKRKCEGCQKTHIEWFDVGEMHAVKVLEKWQKWIMQEPYALNAETGEWVLQPEILDSLAEVCEPVQMETKEPRQQPRRSKRGKGSPRGRKPSC
jgi:predicted GIY-YIG superfamily endonuclease